MISHFATPYFKPHKRFATVLSTMATLAVLLTGCGTSAPTAIPGMASTRTPVPRSSNPAPNETATPKPTGAANTSDATRSPTAVPVRQVNLDACIDVKPDLSATAPAARKSPGQIVYLDSAGNVALTDGSGRRTTQVTTDAFLAEDQGKARAYQFPTFSNDGKLLAFVSLDLTDNGRNMTQTLHVAEARARSKPVDLYSSNVDNIPYLDWSPNSESVAFLTIHSGQGEIRVSPRGGGKIAVFDTGTSAYWHWRSDSNAIVAHLSGAHRSAGSEAHISVIDATASDSQAGTNQIESPPGQFQSPHYSPNGKFMIFALANGDVDELVLADPTGTPVCSITAVNTGAYFAWSPNGQQLAVLDTISPLQMPAKLTIFNLATGDQTVIDQQVVSFYWSPDGSKIAVYSVVTDAPATKLGLGAARQYSPAQQSDNLSLRIAMFDADTGKAITVADTLPSRQFAQFFQFFDQYSRAVTPWSPDGNSLVFVSFNREKQASEIGVAALAQSGDSVSLKRIASGTLAFWSPN